MKTFKFITALTILLATLPTAAQPNIQLNIVTSYSRFNERRPILPEAKVQFIILHTTEGHMPGSLEKLRKKGEAHFIVTQSGQIVQIMDISRLAKHAGRSMWEKTRGIDHSSIGIETEGFHNISPSDAQVTALRGLIAQLRRQFEIPSHNVLTHSMVAYGTPNRWHRDNHRGRKRCGMMMARTDIRRQLGLEVRPQNDPDVLADRLSIGDRALFAFLFNPYTPVSIFTENSRTVSAYITPLLSDVPLPNTTIEQAEVPQAEEPQPQYVASVEHEDKDDIVEFLEIGKDGDTAYALAGNQYAKSTTIYFLPDGRIRTGFEMKNQMPDDLNHLPKGTKVLVGFIYGGKVLPSRSAFSIVKKNWSDPATLYRLPNGKILTGDEIAQNTIIPLNTIVLFQR